MSVLVAALMVLAAVFALAAALGFNGERVHPGWLAVAFIALAFTVSAMPVALN